MAKINNSPKKAYSRAVKLFPAKQVKDFFNIETRSVNEGLEAATEKVNKDTIETFISANIAFTRQHVYIFDLDHDATAGRINNIDFPYEQISDDFVNGWRQIVLMPIVIYNAIIEDEEISREELHCAQPIAIRFRGRKMAIHVTVLERNPSSFINLPKEQILRISKEGDESELVNSIVESVNTSIGCNPCDLTRGIKILMNNDIVDGTSVKHRKEKSISHEVMDEDYTIKKEYPHIFAEMMNNPLESTSCKYLLDDGVFPRRFSATPESGSLVFYTYPGDENQVSNVVDAIISNN